jgi:hypothetical protein
MKAIRFEIVKGKSRRGKEVSMLKKRKRSPPPLLSNQNSTKSFSPPSKSRPSTENFPTDSNDFEPDLEELMENKNKKKKASGRVSPLSNALDLK